MKGMAKSVGPGSKVYQLETIGNCKIPGFYNFLTRKIESDQFLLVAVTGSLHFRIRR